MPPRPLPRVITPPLAEHLDVTTARTRTELRRGNWRSLAAGVVLTRPDEPTREDWADVGIHLGGAGAAVSGWDALQVRGLGDRRPPAAPVLVLSRTKIGRVVGGVRIRGTRRPFDVSLAPLDGPYELVPVVGVARALADAALHTDARRTLAMVTQAVQRGRCSVADLCQEYEHGPRNRSAGLRQALDGVLDGARSVAEAQAAQRLTSGRIPMFELNVPVVNEDGRVLYVLDEFWRDLRAAVEIDSREHHFSADDWEHTLKRHNTLTRHGLALLHYPPRLVTCRGSTFTDDVRAWLVQRSAEVGSSAAASNAVFSGHPAGNLSRSSFAPARAGDQLADSRVIRPNRLG